MLTEIRRGLDLPGLSILFDNDGRPTPEGLRSEMFEALEGVDPGAHSNEELGELMQQVWAHYLFLAVAADAADEKRHLRSVED